jgi:hypothetical protein
MKHLQEYMHAVNFLRSMSTCLPWLLYTDPCVYVRACLRCMLKISVTPHGHRVAVYWDSRRVVKGEEWDQGLAAGLLHSHVILPLLSYGATAPMAFLPKDDPSDPALWKDEEPLGLRRLEGVEEDREDGVLKVLHPPPLLILGHQ